jgi:hypothetical protein
MYAFAKYFAGSRVFTILTLFFTFFHGVAGMILYMCVTVKPTAKKVASTPAKNHFGNALSWRSVYYGTKVTILV